MTKFVIKEIKLKVGCFVVPYLPEDDFPIEQVDILISKNQVLQVLYLKHHVYKISWIRNLMKFTEI